MTLVACRRVEAGHAGPSGGAAFAVWNVLRLQAYACLCTPFRVHPLGCQCQVRTLENLRNPAPIHTDGGGIGWGVSMGETGVGEPDEARKEHAV